jgi:hypothetical protein
MTAMWGVRRIVQADDEFICREFLSVRKKDTWARRNSDWRQIFTWDRNTV